MRLAFLSKIRWNVQRKIVAGFVCVLLLVGVFSWLSLDRMNQIQNKAEVISSQWMRGVESVNKLSYLMEHTVTMTFRHIDAQSTSEHDYIESEIHDTLEQINEQFAIYEDLITDDEERSNYDNLKLQWEQFVVKNLRTLEYSSQGGASTTVARKMNIEHISVFNQLQSYVNLLVFHNNEGAAAAEEEASGAHQSAVNLSVTIMIVILLLVIGVAWFITMQISRPLVKVTRNIVKVADGDLSVERIEVKNKDELGDLAEATNHMVDQLTRLIIGVRTTTDHVAASSSELSANAEHTAGSVTMAAEAVTTMAERAEFQYRGAEDSSRAMEEMSAGIGRIAEYSSEAANSSKLTESKAKLGNERVNDSTAHMHSIDQSFAHLSEVVEEMSSHTQQIGQIIDVISDISTQTNLLSLNASIEAARAGEHGRGFSVVAQEVKKLAEQSSHSASQVAAIVKQIQQVSKQASEAMLESTEKVKLGIEAIGETGRAFEDISYGVTHLDQHIHEISAIAEQLSAGSQQVAAAAESAAGMAKESASVAQDLSGSTQEQLAAIEEVSASATTLASNAKDLQRMISQFKLKETA